MSDLDQEAQAKIEEMMYNDRQKKLGLPQTHESVSVYPFKINECLRHLALATWTVQGFGVRLWIFYFPTQTCEKVHKLQHHKTKWHVGIHPV